MKPCWAGNFPRKSFSEDKWPYYSCWYNGPHGFRVSYIEYKPTSLLKYSIQFTLGDLTRKLSLLCRTHVAFSCHFLSSHESCHWPFSMAYRSASPLPPWFKAQSLAFTSSCAGGRCWRPLSQQSWLLAFCSSNSGRYFFCFIETHAIK